jgi:GR25 family glycosyltransferase involved in LPS biosynthesis
MLNFDKIFVISLTKKRSNKAVEFMDSLPQDWNIGEVCVFDAIDGDNEELPLWWPKNMTGSYGCLKSHLSILDLILSQNLLNTLIIEDDAIFCDNFIQRLENVLRDLPDDWEQLYLGGQHLSKFKVINKDLVRVGNVNRTHCYIIRNKNTAQKMISYLTDKDFWIKNLTQKKYHIDYAYGTMHKNNTVVAYASLPFLVGQKSTQFSDTGSQISSVTRWWN